MNCDGLCSFYGRCTSLVGEDCWTLFIRGIFFDDEGIRSTRSICLVLKKKVEEEFVFNRIHRYRILIKVEDFEYSKLTPILLLLRFVFPKS